MTEDDRQPLSEEAALRQLEELHRAIEQSRMRRKNANEAFDQFLRSFERPVTAPSAPEPEEAAWRRSVRPPPFPPRPSSAPPATEAPPPDASLTGLLPSPAMMPPPAAAAPPAPAVPQTDVPPLVTTVRPVAAPPPIVAPPTVAPPPVAAPPILASPPRPAVPPAATVAPSTSQRDVVSPPAPAPSAAERIELPAAEDLNIPAAWLPAGARDDAAAANAAARPSWPESSASPRGADDLGLDDWEHPSTPTVATAAFPAESEAAGVTRSSQPAETRLLPAALTVPRSAVRITPLMAVLAALVIAAGAFYLWRPTSRGVESSSPEASPKSTPLQQPGSAASPAAAPAPAPPPQATAPPAAEVIAVRTVWVRVLVDGRKAVEQELPPGTRIALPSGSQIVVRAGDAGALRVVIGGKDQGPVGRDGVVATKSYTLETKPAR